MLIIYPCVPASAESTLDCSEWSSACEQWLWWRGSPSASRTWSTRWKRESWIRALSTRTYSDSHGKNIEDSWISSLADSRASHLAPLEIESQQKTNDTSGPSSNEESLFSGLESVSSKTSTESQPQNPQATNRFSTMSSATWKSWVTEQRRDALQRRKSVPHTSEGDGSSLRWPTSSARDWKDTPGMSNKRSDRTGDARAADQLPRAVYNWPTPTPIHAIRGNHDEPVASYQKRVTDYEEGRAKGKPGKSLGVAVRWPTPTVAEGGKIGNRANHSQPSLSNHPEIHGPIERELLRKSVGGQKSQVTPSMYGKSQGLLNPNWVEQLMGYPSGWTDFALWATR